MAVPRHLRERQCHYCRQGQDHAGEAQNRGTIGEQLLFRAKLPEPQQEQKMIVLGKFRVWCLSCGPASMEMTVLRLTLRSHPGRVSILLRRAKKSRGFSLLLVSKPAESFQRVLSLGDDKTFHSFPSALK